VIADAAGPGREIEEELQELGVRVEKGELVLLE
jgi:hypothetical protein